MPEFEDLAMRLAELMGIQTVPHALIKINDEYAYITKRVDRDIEKNEIKLYAMEDFCQLSNRLTQDKYKGSYENCGRIIKKYSITPGLDLSELYLRVVGSFIIGNSDMHLKNFSLRETEPGNRRFQLSNAYDMLPVNVIMPEDKEQMALTINGKKRNIHKKEFKILAEVCDIPANAAEKMIEKLEKLLEPFANKLAQQRHLQAISSGMMMPLGLIVIGSLFLIVANPPINLDLVDLHTGNIFLKALISWKQFAVANYDVLTLPYNYTMGLVGLISAFGIAYCLAESYQMKSAVYGIIAMCTFLMVSAPLKDGGIQTSYLGADGLFVAIIIALISVEISRFVSKKLVISFPASVPSAVTDFVNSLLPLAANIIIIYGLNIALVAASGKNLPDFIMSILTPAISGVDNIWMFMGIYLFSNILWLFGINGSSIVFPIVFALCISNTGINAELVNAGKEPTALINLQMFRYVLIGGAGNTLGLVLLMCKSKSKHIRSIGRLSVLPGICGINEPIIFGTPIVLNPILSIPFLIMPCISSGLGYLVQKMGIVSLGYIVDPSFTPFFAQGFLSALDIRNVIFMFVLIAISVAVYYPFFKVYEKNTLDHEGE